MYRILLAVAAIAVAACAAGPAHDAGHAALVDRLGRPPPEAQVLRGAVSGPNGDRELEVRFGPGPVQRVRQVRAGAVTDFGRAGDRYWRQSGGAASRLSDDYAFFFEMHRLTRPAGMVADWRPAGAAGTDRVEGGACRVLAWTDAVGRPAEMCVDPDSGLPRRITLHPPPAYGGGTLHVLPDNWHEHDGRVYLLGYRVWHGLDSYVHEWDEPRPPAPDAAPVNVPAGLFEGANGTVEASGGSVE